MCQQWRVSSIHITITLLQIAHRTLPRMEIHCLVVLKSHLWPNLGRMIRVNSGQVFMRLNHSYVFSYKKTYYVHDYIIYQYSRDCIELSVFLTLFKTVFDFCRHWQIHWLPGVATSTVNTAHNCVVYQFRFSIQGLHATLREPDTAELCYSFIALLSLD